jgi:hypothetical protein
MLFVDGTAVVWKRYEFRLSVDRWCEETEVVLDAEEAVKESPLLRGMRGKMVIREFVWVECEEEMVRLLWPISDL